nr:hypothetical protein CFP56_01324 [Quercus suber]
MPVCSVTNHASVLTRDPPSPLSCRYWDLAASRKSFQANEFRSMKLGGRLPPCIVVQRTRPRAVMPFLTNIGTYLQPLDIIMWSPSLSQLHSLVDVLKIPDIIRPN